MRTGFRAVAAALALVAAFAGGYALNPKLRPETLYTAWAKYVRGQPSHKETLNDGVLEMVMATDFARLIDVHSRADADRKRAAAAEFIFRGEPAGMNRRPDLVEHDQLFPPLFDLKLAGIDILTVRMPFGVESRVFHLRAANPRSCLMIYQEGHRVSFLERTRFIKRMTSEGCDVLALALPLTGGINNRPTVDHPRFGRILLNDPDDLQLLNSRSYSSLAYFITPLVAALNHALDERSYERIGATGFSGGGWAVQIFAALEPRVQVTYSVAGSSPTGVHAAKPEWGSPEQRAGLFYEIANYSELYVMAADRAGRRHVQFFNDTDPCCFAGRSWMAWNAPVGDRIRQLGGGFRIFSYQNSEHTLSKPVALTIVDDFLYGGRAIPEGVSAH
ncbi:MAG: hypothetical protein ACM3Q1_02160 [Bacteroidales bacterium]